MLLFWMFISYYTTIYFFVKKNFFWNVHISLNTIFECLYLFLGWKMGHQLRGAGMGGHPKWVQLRTGGRGCHTSCEHMHLHYLKKSVRQKRLFFSNEINFCRHEISFYIKLLLRTKVSQNAFNFNQIKS